MKKNLAVMIAALMVTMSVFAHKKDPEYLKARRNGGELRLIVSAVDDYGIAVSNASVNVLMKVQPQVTKLKLRLRKTDIIKPQRSCAL